MTPSRWTRKAETGDDDSRVAALILEGVDEDEDVEWQHIDS